MYNREGKHDTLDESTNVMLTAIIDCARITSVQVHSRDDIRAAAGSLSIRTLTRSENAKSERDRERERRERMR